MSAIRKLTRRAFLASVGITGLAAGGLILTGKHTALQNRIHSLTHKSPEKVRLFIRIGSDDSVQLVCHRVEMGQGVRTSLPLILAEELEADWAKVEVVQTPANPDLGIQYTAGSRSVMDSYQTMRELGATARKMLEQAAAITWNVTPSECQTRNHEVKHLPTHRTLRFGELAELASTLPVPAITPSDLKPVSAFRYIGKATPSVDLGKFVNGAAEYTADIHIPGMVYAVVEHAPVIGAKLLTLDDSETRRLPGIIDVIKLPEQQFPMAFKPLHGVAVIASNTWTAIKGREKLKCTWSDSIYSERGSEQLMNQLSKSILTPGESVYQKGDTEKALVDATQTLEATYTQPYLAHASMEPPVAVADAGWNSCRMWVSSQDPQNVRHEVAALLNIPLHNVEINVPLLGGGFGRKAKGDFCAQAALISASIRKPVKLLWTREDDIRFDYFHAMSVMHMTAAINEALDITAWRMRAAYPSIQSLYNTKANRPGTAEMQLGFFGNMFDLPNMSAETHSADESVRIGWFRSVTAIQYAFANNCFADELAAARKKSPLDNLLELIGPDRKIDPAQWKMDYPRNNAHPIDTARLKKVLTEVAIQSGYPEAEPNCGWGLAAFFSFPTSCAAATKVRVEDGKLNVEQVHLAIDCGQVVNVDGVRAQLEGSVVFALSFALTGRIDIEKGKVRQKNFDDYTLLKISQCPEIHIHILDSSSPPSGAGEPAVPVIAPSLANAIFAATGTRIRSLPLSEQFVV